MDRTCPCVVGLLVFWLALPVFGQEAGDVKKQLARQIHQAVEKIHAVRTERLRLRERHRARMAEVERQIERLKNEVTKMDVALRKEKKLVNGLEAKIRRAGKIEQLTGRMISQAVELAVPVVARIKTRIETGIPYRKRKRQERIKRIAKGLRDPVLRLRAEALGDYLKFFAEELRLANSISLWNEPVLLADGGQKKNAYQVRLGLVNQFFISEDGRTTGLGAKRMGREWNTRLERAQRQQLRIALDILRQRRPPEVISIPVTVMSGPRLPEPAPGRQAVGHDKSKD